MKKLYTILLAAALGATAVSAEQTVFIGETGYDDLASAVSAATDGATITIKGNQTITSRLELGNKSLTLKGENNPVLTRTMSNIMLLVNAANENVVLNFEGLTFDGNNDDSKTTIEAKNGNNKAHIAFTDCKFTNNTDKALQTKYFTTLTNVSADGDVFVGNNNRVTIAGTANYPMYIESSYAIAAGENLSGAVKIRLQEGQYTSGRTIVNNCSDASLFTLTNAPEGYSLEANEGKLVLAFNKYVVKNESTGVSYTSLEEALTDMTQPEEGDNVLTVLESIDVTSRIGTNSGILACTIKGATPDVTLRRTFTNTRFVSNNKSLKFENLTLDCNNYSGKDYDFEANAGTLSFKDVKIINCATKVGFFSVKVDNRTLVLDNCSYEECTAANVINLNGKLQLAGDNAFNIIVANAGASITAIGELTNTTPIEISFADGVTRENGQVMVYGTEQTEAFKLTDGRFLNAEEGNLVLSETEQTGIEGVEAADALVNVYNLQGVLVKQNVSRAAAAADLTPGVYVIGGLKTLVR